MTLPDKLEVHWEAHLEALPLATWITRTREGSSGSLECGAVFLNLACRELLGLEPQASRSPRWLRYVHPFDRDVVGKAWSDFVEGRSARFHQIVRWVRPDTKETTTLAVRAQKLLCGDIQGWLRSATAEGALSRLEELAHARP